MAPDGPKKRRSLQPRVIVRYGAHRHRHGRRCSLAAHLRLAAFRAVPDSRSALLPARPARLRTGEPESRSCTACGTLRARRFCASSSPTTAAASTCFRWPTRRKQLLNVRWVHDASIARDLAGSRRRADQRAQAGRLHRSCPPTAWRAGRLIDDEGVILDPPPKAPFQLPVLTGVLRGENAGAAAGVRVRRMQRLHAGSRDRMADNVSEVDVARSRRFENHRTSRTAAPCR